MDPSTLPHFHDPAVSHHHHSPNHHGPNHHGSDLHDMPMEGNHTMGEPNSGLETMNDPESAGGSGEPKFMGHVVFSSTDYENPQNWPLHKKVYVCAAATAFGFATAFGLTAYTAGITGVMAQFNISMTKAIVPYSLYLLGIAFAPIHTPHFTERFGRNTVYLVSQPIFALFTLGAGYSQNFSSLAACRFFAGFFGGPALVLIEGTFADVWHSKVTVSYYSVLTLASYVGAGCGMFVAKIFVD